MKLSILSVAIFLTPLCLATTLKAETLRQLPQVVSSEETNNSSASPTHKYPPQIVQAFMTACNRPDKNLGINMEQICTCSINKIQNQYTLEQFITIGLAIKDKKEPPNEIIDLALQCFTETQSSQR